MKILVIDDEQSFANLLGHALRRLGHAPVIALDPRDALDIVGDGFDAVITDIDMPVMDGVSLARTIRERHAEVPVAFCTGSNPEGETVAEAQTIGRVLPKVWTVADVRSLLDELAQESDRLRRTPRGSVRDLRSGGLPRPALMGRELTPRPEMREPAPRARLRRVRLDVSDWRRVEGLCKSSVEGPVFITVRSPGEAAPGDSLSVALRMPDEITVSIAGEVQALRPAGDREESELIVELTGLTSDLAARLASLAAPSKDALVGQYLDARRPHALAWSGARNRRATSNGDNDGSCHGRPRRAESNDELRSQIEVLGRRLRRKS